MTRFSKFVIAVATLWIASVAIAFFVSTAQASVRNPGDPCEGQPTVKRYEQCQANRDVLTRYHGKLRVWAVYHPKNNTTSCDLTDSRIKKGWSGDELRHSHWRMNGKHSAEDCLNAWSQQ